MKLTANYHTHTALCGHAIGMSADYLNEAVRYGYAEIGMSDHGPIPRSFMSREDYVNNWLERQMDERIFEETYLPDLAKAKATFGSNLSIRTGLEIEYLPGHDDYYRYLLTKVEYLLLGVHYFVTPHGIQNTYMPTTKEDILNYADAVEMSLATGFFKVLVHPDLFLIEYKDAFGNWKFDKTAEMVSRRIVEASIRHNIPLEINLGGVRKGRLPGRGDVDYLYPRRAFWEIVEQYPAAKVLLGCDAHRPSELADASIQEGFAFANSFSFPILTKLDWK
jgi:histidinol-phosphatase (PHP family)